MAKVRVNCGQVTEGCAAKLFVAYNTTHNSLYVLAQDRQEAIDIAYTANHVYFPEQKIAGTYSRLAEEVKTPLGYELTKHWDSIQGAIASRVRGTVHFEGDHIAISYEALVR